MSDNKNVNGCRYSAINAMHSCRKHVWHVYGKRDKGSENKFAKLGSVIHNVIEEYLRYCLENNFDTDFTFLDDCIIKNRVFIMEDQVSDYNQICECIKNNINCGSFLPYKDSIQIEKRLKFNDKMEYIEEGIPYFSSGIDISYRDGNTRYVTDWKSVRSIYSKTYMINSLQRKVYSYILLKEDPTLEMVMFAYNFVRYGYQSDWMGYSREDLEDLEKEIKQEIKEYYKLIAEEDEPSGDPSGFCILCPIKGMCIEYQNAYDKIERIDSDDDAVELFRQYQICGIRLKQMEEMLKFYVDHNNPIRLKDEEYGPIPGKKIEYKDPKKTIEAIKKFCPEGSIYDLVNITSTSVKKFVKKFKLPKDKIEEIENTAKVSQTTKYKVVKIEEDIEATEASDEVVDIYF